MKSLKYFILTALMLLPVWASAESWWYYIQENEFVDGYDIAAMLEDEEGVTTFSIVYSPMYGVDKKPRVGILYDDPENYIINPCFDDCVIYINADGKKFPAFKANAVDRSYIFKDPTKVLNAIKGAKTIKIQLPPPVWGEVSVHTYHADKPLDLERLESPK